MILFLPDCTHFQIIVKISYDLSLLSVCMFSTPMWEVPCMALDDSFTPYGLFEARRGVVNSKEWLRVVVNSLGS